MLHVQESKKGGNRFNSQVFCKRHLLILLDYSHEDKFCVLFWKRKKHEILEMVIQNTFVELNKF